MKYTEQEIDTLINHLDENEGPNHIFRDVPGNDPEQIAHEVATHTRAK